MDWSLELRTYRARNGLKQEALADLLEISQAYVSRLESGKTEPKDGLEHKIRTLIANPSRLDVLDFVLKSIRVSPHIGCLIAEESEDLIYVALSDGFRRHPLFKMSKEGSPLPLDTINESDRLTRELFDSGFFTGEINHVEVLWKSRHGKETLLWDSVLTPFQAGNGKWLLYNAMSPLDAEEFDARMSSRGSPMRTYRSAPSAKNGSFTGAC